MRIRLIALATALLGVAVLSAGPAPAAEALAGSGKPETRTLDLAAFTRIDLGGTFNASIGFGKTQRVEVTIDDNLWDNLRAEVDDGRLTLDWNEHCQPTVPAVVKIVMAAPLEEFTLAGAGNALVAGLSGKHLDLYLRGTGSTALEGFVESLQVILTGAGSCDAGELKAKDVKVVLSGVGDCHVHATASLDVRLSGVGNVTYRGDPQEKTTEVTGRGEIMAR
ncbi:MAG: DUF2807 domain-containing protein [Candidatus Krumholzibacteriia bacterium]